MILAVDVYYKEALAQAVGVLFSAESEKIVETIIEFLENKSDYLPGQLYKRELPCIMKVIEKVDLSLLEAIIIDGHVYINNSKEFGLGGRLWAELDEKVPIIGVAKNSFHSNTEMVEMVFRGKSNKPLFISSFGIELPTAAELIKNMKGNFRIPDILKMLDRKTKEDW